MNDILLGIVGGVIASLIFLVFMYFVNKEINKNSHSHTVEDGGSNNQPKPKGENRWD